MWYLTLVIAPGGRGQVGRDAGEEVVGEVVERTIAPFTVPVQQDELPDCVLMINTPVMLNAGHNHFGIIHNGVDDAKLLLRVGVDVEYDITNMGLQVVVSGSSQAKIRIMEGSALEIIE